MKTALLKRAERRGLGWRTWRHATAARITLMVPSKGIWRNAGPLRGWHLRWDVPHGERGLNLDMHPKLGRAIIKDMIEGTHKTHWQRSL